jgi:hypothetical protein
MDGSEHLIVTLEARQAVAANLLGRLADDIDITPTQYARAKTAYETVGQVVQNAGGSILANAKVFPQGSFAIGTIIKPVDREDGEFDVDLACRLAVKVSVIAPQQAKAMLGNALKGDGRYEPKLREKTRCWRIEYAGDFHLDICPLAIVSQQLDAIPDKELAQWVYTAPERYAEWFNKFADRVRDTRFAKDLALEAHVDPFPDANENKGWLRRVVQLLKRHRDQWRLNAHDDLKEFAPISIILTTLAARVVERHTEFFSAERRPFEVVNAILQGLTGGIEVRNAAGQPQIWVQSPVADENFANRWNEDPKWQQAFQAWLADAKASVAALVDAHGLDSGNDALAKGFGNRIASRVLTEYGSAMAERRDRNELTYTAAGLGVSASGLAVPRHTFFGE